MDFKYHEELYRGREVLDKIRDFPLTICGAGALGANIAESLARMGFGRITLIDMDRVEEHNLSTQPYQKSDIGAEKARIMANYLYRSVGARVEAVGKKLTAENAAKLLKGSGLVIDAFDNSISRGVLKQHCEDNELPCLHAGLSAEYAEVIWNEIYRVPSDAQDDICDYPLARNLVSLAVAVSCESIIAFVAKGEQKSFTITLGDFSIREFQ